jgi:glycosyltransferase involved in cell wall biosynthesis
MATELIHEQAAAARYGTAHTPPDAFATPRRAALAAAEAEALPTRWPFSISVVIPAFNEGATISAVIQAVREQCPDAEIIVVDDASTDDTVAQAASAAAMVIQRPYNIGNGAGVKTGIRAASGEVILIIDGDGQHNPADIPLLLAHMDRYDMVIGTRDRSSQQNALRWLGNSALNRLGSYLMGMEMRDLTSGFRAMRRAAIREFLHLLPNQFSWPTTSALAFAKAGYHVRFEPITVAKRRSGQSTQKLFSNGVKFGLIILRIVSLFAPLRVYFPIAMAMFAFSLLSFLISFFITDPLRWHIPNSTVGLFVGGVIVFMFGLLAEQIANLRLKGPDRDE